MPQNKTCAKCRQVLPATEEYFERRTDGRRRLRPSCRSCIYSAIKKWQAEHAEAQAGNRREYFRKNAVRFQEVERRRRERLPHQTQAESLIKGMRQRSRRFGKTLPDEVASKEFLVQWFKDQPNCECCGIKFDFKPRRKTWRLNSPSLDRFDNKQWYTLGNVALICWNCNSIKKSYSAGQLRMVANWMDRRAEKDGRSGLDGLVANAVMGFAA